MLLDAPAAKALFAIVLSTTQGAETLNPQLPLHVTDRGDNWLVTGTPYTDAKLHSRYCMCHMFFLKRSAKVTGVDCHARFALTHQEEVYWSKIMAPDQMRRVFGPPSNFEPDGIPDIWFAVYHGIINSPSAATDYAAVLMRMKPGLSNVRPSDLRAVERNKVWHITSGSSGTRDLLTISRETGEVLANYF